MLSSFERLAAAARNNTADEKEEDQKLKTQEDVLGQSTPEQRKQLHLNDPSNGSEQNLMSNYLDRGSNDKAEPSVKQSKNFSEVNQVE